MEIGEYPLYGPLAREAYDRLSEAVAFYRLQFRLSAEVGLHYNLHPDNVNLAAYMHLTKIVYAQNQEEEQAESLNVLRNAVELTQIAILLSDIRQHAFHPQTPNPA